MIRDVVRDLPAAWRCTVTVERPTEGQYGLPGGVAQHAVDECLVSSQSSAEEPESRSADPETVAWLYAPVGSDFTSVDTVVVPGPAGTTVTLADGTVVDGSGPFIRPWGRFHVSGRPDPSPLGIRVPLRR